MSHPRILLLLSALLTLSAGATAAVASAEPPSGRALTVVAEPGPRLLPTQIEYHWLNGALKLTGRIEKQHNHAGRILGHVDIELLDADGRVIGRTTGHLQQFSPSARNPRWATFYALIDPVPAATTKVRLRHAVGKRW